MFASVGNESEKTDEFAKTLDSYLKEFLDWPKSTHGFIAISGEDEETIRKRYALVMAKFAEDRKLVDRIELPRLGTSYQAVCGLHPNFGSYRMGLMLTYTPFTYDVFCPTFRISGPSVESLADATLTYVAVVHGGDEITYMWSVIGGKITSGHGTSAIRVLVDRPSPASVKVTLKIGGLPKEGNCIESAELETMLRQK